MIDFLVVGSGLTGATMARVLTDHGYKVLILERRSHIGGNVYDEVHESGIHFHTYGPHIFRTSSQKIWGFVTRFADFRPNEYSVSSKVGNNYAPWPINENYIIEQCGENWQASFTGEVTNFEEAVLAKMPEKVYRQIIKGYTEKQWGVAAHTLSANLAARVSINKDNKRRLTTKKNQGLPTKGYHQMMKNMLEGIPVIMGCDYLTRRDEFQAKQVIYTGPIDEYFGYDLGRLEYRGQKRQVVYSDEDGLIFPTAQVNYPSREDGLHVRSIEWKHLMTESERESAYGSLISYEVPTTPVNPDHFEYPFPSAANQKLYKDYRKRANELENVLICGRLGEYQYFDMDQAIGRALSLVKRKFIRDTTALSLHP